MNNLPCPAPLARRVGAAVLFLMTLGFPAFAQQTAHADQPVLPRDLEIELALNAAPKHLRDGAAVLVLDAGGYVKAREGSNAFTCLVSRRGGDVFPVCWDAEGVKSLLPIDLDAAKARLAGRTNAEIEQTVAAGFKDGRYRAPSRTGIAYMLSPLRYRIDEQGHAVRANPNPHVMFYGANLTDSDIGGARGSVVFKNKVGPDGMIIVPVGVTERATILEESQSLVDRFERHIGYTSAR
jgi:hypothetical protein